MKEPIVKLYGASGCPQCMGAQAYLKQKNVGFEYIDVRKDPAGMAVLDNLGTTTIPVICAGDLFVCGYHPAKIDTILMEVLNDASA